MKFKGHLVVLVTGLIGLPFLSYGEDWIKFLQDTAERRDAEAGLEIPEGAEVRAYVNRLYERGRVVPEDSEPVLLLAAEHGNVKAQFILAMMYSRTHFPRMDASRDYFFSPRSVPSDYTKAARWWRLLAEQGDPRAQRWLGAAYTKGQGVPQDHKEAVKWYRLAAEQARRVAEQGDAKDQYDAGKLYELGGDYTEAVKWYRLAAEQGYSKGQKAMGLYCYRGICIPKDYPQAYAWFKISLDQNDVTVAEKQEQKKIKEKLDLMSLTPEQEGEGKRLRTEIEARIRQNKWQK